MRVRQTTRFKLSTLFLCTRILTTSSALTLVAISHYGHTEFQRPAAILEVYLSPTLLLDLAHNQTIYLDTSSSSDTIIVLIQTTTFACKAVLAI